MGRFTSNMKVRFEGRDSPKAPYMYYPKMEWKLDEDESSQTCGIPHLIKMCFPAPTQSQHIDKNVCCLTVEPCGPFLRVFARNHDLDAIKNEIHGFFHELLYPGDGYENNSGGKDVRILALGFDGCANDVISTR